MEAEIFSVGSEILLGNITDTNSQYIADKFKNYGINVHKMVTVGDNSKRLLREMEEADGKVDIIITTGGLGPTEDDLTKETAFALCGLEDEVEIHKESLEDLKARAGDDKEKLDNNLKQVKFPKSARVLKNDNGTAPGCILKSKKGTRVICLPGPPYEMKPMFEKELAPLIKKEGEIAYRDLQIGLLGEWDLARRVDLDSENPTLAPLVKDEGPILRITAKAETDQACQRLLDQKEEEVRGVFKDLVITSDGRSKAQVLLDLLRERGETVITAESITGGMLASKLIDIPGASNCLKESLVVYSDQAKEKLLGVSHETLETYTAVSPETCREMVEGLSQRYGRDLSIATTGYAHTGEAYAGISYQGKTIVKAFNIKGTRNRVRARLAGFCLDLSILLMRGTDESYFNL